MIRFHVPGQPQGKGRPQVVKIGGFTRMATPKKTVAYEGLVAHAASLAMAGRPLVEVAVSVRMWLNHEVPASWSMKKQRMALAGEVLPTGKPDADNVVKAVFDGLNGVVWKDDTQVVDLVLKKRYSGTPGVVVEIELASHEPQQPQLVVGQPVEGVPA